MKSLATWIKVFSIIIGSIGAFTHHLFPLVIGFAGLILALCVDSLAIQPGIPRIYPAKDFPKLCKRQEKRLLRRYSEPKPRKLESLRGVMGGFGITRLVIISLMTVELDKPPQQVLTQNDLLPCESGNEAYGIIRFYIDQYRESHDKEGQSSNDLKVYEDNAKIVAFCLKLTFELTTHGIKQGLEMRISGEGERRTIPISRRPA